jgi:putative heme-binding domain-containing protein
VETWVRLAPGIGNEDGILGAQGQLDMNFFGSQFRVWAGPEVKDAIVAKKKMVPDNWTHIAVTRDVQGRLKIYIDGELDQDQGKPAPQAFPNVRIGWTQQKKGTDGMFCEYRIWKRARTAEEIRNNFDRALDPAKDPKDLVYHAPGGGPWGHLHGQAALARTSDYPPLFTPEEATALDAKFDKYRKLALAPGGDAVRGKNVAAICMACHLIQGQGGNIAPYISGAGTMGVEALLRNIITPNAAMEAGYRIFRVELKSGELVDAFFVSEDKDAVIVRQPGLPDRRLPRGEIRQTQYLRQSLMPEGILDGLMPQQVTDLFAYLLSLKG